MILAKYGLVCEFPLLENCHLLQLHTDLLSSEIFNKRFLFLWKYCNIAGNSEMPFQ